MKYRTRVNVHHDGEKYLPGATIELDDSDAGELLKCGAIEPLNKPFAAKSVSVSVKLNKDNDDV